MTMFRSLATAILIFSSTITVNRSIGSTASPRLPLQECRNLREATKDESYVGTRVKESPDGRNITLVNRCSKPELCVHFTGPYTTENLDQECMDEKQIKVTKD